MIPVDRYSALACAVVQQAVDNVKAYPTGFVPNRREGTREWREQVQRIRQAAWDRAWLRDPSASAVFVQLAGLDHEAMVCGLTRQGVLHAP